MYTTNTPSIHLQAAPTPRNLALAESRRRRRAGSTAHFGALAASLQDPPRGGGDGALRPADGALDGAGETCAPSSTRSTRRTPRGRAVEKFLGYDAPRAASPASGCSTASDPAIVVTKYAFFREESSERRKFVRRRRFSWAATRSSTTCIAVRLLRPCSRRRTLRVRPAPRAAHSPERLAPTWSSITSSCRSAGDGALKAAEDFRQRPAARKVHGSRVSGRNGPCGASTSPRTADTATRQSRSDARRRAVGRDVDLIELPRRAAQPEGRRAGDAQARGARPRPDGDQIALEIDRVIARSPPSARCSAPTSPSATATRRASSGASVHHMGKKPVARAAHRRCLLV